jgi:DNA-nicking Smr family endonuclease
MFSKLKKLFKGDQLPKHKPEPEKSVQDQDCKPAAPLNSKTNYQLKEPVMEKAVDKSPPRRPSPELKRNKKGIRVIDKHQEMIDLFPVEDIVLDADPEEQSAPVLQVITEQKTVKNRSFKSVVRTTKNGFPILDDMDDFSLFIDKEPCHVKRSEDDEKLSGRPTDGGQQNKHLKHKNKHGIPLLPDIDSWHSNDNSSETEKNEFMRLLNDSLGGKTRHVLMNEKGVRTVRKKTLSLKEKVKRYPLPQSQLDLHGYTAIKAELRSETFLKNAYGNQMHTVIIIVGKGLHSDDGAVLPDVIESLLIRLRKEGVVLLYEWENEKKSRSGSVIVYLNNMVFD